MPTSPNSLGAELRRLRERDDRVFSPHPQVTLYFPSAAMENARVRIQRAIDRGDGPALVVGGAGTGKSLLLQTLAAKYREKFDVVLLACARTCTRRALLQAILFELGLPYHQRDEGRLRFGLLDQLLSPNTSPAGLLLLVDEAQSLPLTLLDELRVMTNLMRGGSPRVRLVLAGSAQLEESFAHPDLESFSQRLSARCYLAPLSRTETTQFVRAQLATLGARPDAVFDAGAVDAVFDASDGVPRLVNQLCDRSLSIAETENRSCVDRQTVQAAWADLQQLPVPWDTTQPTTGDRTGGHQVIQFGSLDEQSVAIQSEPENIEPTELDLDDEGMEAESMLMSLPKTRIAEFGTPHNPQGLSEQTAHRELEPARKVGNDAQDAGRSPRDPANPFAEAFEEEEIVLDCFAAWDEMFQRRTPRVENIRDCKLTALFEAAVESYPILDQRPVECNQVDPPGASEVAEATIAPIDASDPAPLGEEPTGRRPRLRLVDVPDGLSEDSAPETAPGRSRRRTIDSPERPILIVDDDGLPVEKPASPVRRLAYQHLFSRLRSG